MSRADVNGYIRCDNAIDGCQWTVDDYKYSLAELDDADANVLCDFCMWEETE